MGDGCDELGRRAAGEVVLVVCLPPPHPTATITVAPSSTTNPKHLLEKPKLAQG